ncbi:MAG: flagellar basal body-associated FliL family protein [Rhodobacteraceae bacterium]|nr:flagellar basal body-associated FliL family protein [Paracoccaceae bacterium]
MKKLLPILLILMATGIGVGAGLALRPGVSESPKETACTCETTQEDLAKPIPEPTAQAPTDKEYVKLNNQFVVPVLANEKVTSIVLLSLSLEVTSGEREHIFAVEPKLRDAFLQTMFDHANMGGFKGSFTNSSNLDILRQALRETAYKTIGPTVSDVLIIDIARQEV